MNNGLLHKVLHPISSRHFFFVTHITPNKNKILNNKIEKGRIVPSFKQLFELNIFAEWSILAIFIKVISMNFINFSASY